MKVKAQKEEEKGRKIMCFSFVLLLALHELRENLLRKTVPVKKNEKHK